MKNVAIKPTFVIDWDCDLIKSDYNPIVNDKFIHSSVEEVRKVTEEPVSLENCLAKFSENEEMTEKDECHCSL
jgi:hypothetical protein